MAASFEGANRPVYWGELVELLAEPDSQKAFQDIDRNDKRAVADAITNLCPHKPKY